MLLLFVFPVRGMKRKGVRPHLIFVTNGCEIELLYDYTKVQFQLTSSMRKTAGNCGFTFLKMIQKYFIVLSQNLLSPKNLSTLFIKTIDDLLNII